ncbi:hypothetical protein [Pantoea sp. At-9b]|uniref:hypothetical protein n=1 Tax=Pantoea sp. (strain At-9b) TaxID=592316 RepID=UPI0002E11403|nr:hypothetical protein [Pantoea sp. At-9b]
MTLTIAMMVVNKTTLALLLRAGHMPAPLASWPLWRVSVLIAAGIVSAQYFLQKGKARWRIPLAHVIAWLFIPAWYGAFAFWYWQIPVIDMQDLCLPSLSGMAITLLFIWFHLIETFTE